MTGSVQFKNKPTEGNQNLLEPSYTGLIESIKKGGVVIESSALYGIGWEDS